MITAKQELNNVNVWFDLDTLNIDLIRIEDIPEYRKEFERKEQDELEEEKDELLLKGELLNKKDNDRLNYLQYLYSANVKIRGYKYAQFLINKAEDENQMDTVFEWTSWLNYYNTRARQSYAKALTYNK